MNEAIVRMLNRYECQSVEDHVRAFREIMQEIALLGLWRSKFFEKAAFYGGTALRILYGMRESSFRMSLKGLWWIKHPLEPLAAWFSISLSLDEHQRAAMAAAASKPLFTQSPMPMPR
jgi:hypothetical protein